MKCSTAAVSALLGKLESGALVTGDATAPEGFRAALDAAYREAGRPLPILIGLEPVPADPSTKPSSCARLPE